MSSKTNERLADTPKEALSQYIGQLQQAYYPWYERWARIHSGVWLTLQLIGIASSIVAAAIAGIADKSEFEHFGAVRIALVGLPLVGTGVATFLGRTGARELFVLRERGRETMQTLISTALADFAANAADPHALAAIHRALIARVDELERRQSHEFFEVTPGGAQVTKPTGAPSAATSAPVSVRDTQTAI